MLVQQPPHLRAGGAVLQRAVALMGAPGSKMRMGDAIDLAKNELGIELQPDIEQAVLTALFKIIASGKLPGAADA